MNRPHAWYRVGAVLGAAGLALSACESPLERSTTEALRGSILESAQRELREAETSPSPRTTESTAKPLNFSAERFAEIEQMSGPDSYGNEAAPELEDLLGRTNADGSPVFRISLEQSIRSAVSGNIALQAASIQPAIRQSQVVAAEATFDWVFYTDFQWGITDEPQVSVIPGAPAVSQAQSVGYQTGLRKDLTSGGRFTIAQGLTYRDDTSTGVTPIPNPANQTFLELGLDQPLLRGFGSDVALAEIRLARNVERATVEELRRELYDTITETERAYWRLFGARDAVLIRRRLMERGIKTRDVLESRLGVDARPAEYSDAVARVESRRAAVIRAENDLREASDALKRLINDSGLPVGGEALLVAIDEPVEQPVEYSLADSFTTALANRPEIQQAILAIDDASIRQMVARNGRLPQLDLTLEARFLGLNEDAGDAYRDIGEARFMNWLLGLAFEQAIGNRGAEAVYRQRQLERIAAVVTYRDAVQAVIQEVKTALRGVTTNYRLIGQTRVARQAAAENLRTLLVLEETVASLTPDFLDLKFRRQDALAQSEVEEVLALIDYNVAMAELARSKGSAAERNGIRFVAPSADEIDTSWAESPQP